MTGLSFALRIPHSPDIYSRREGYESSLGHTNSLKLKHFFSDFSAYLTDIGNT